MIHITVHIVPTGHGQATPASRPSQGQNPAGPNVSHRCALVQGAILHGKQARICVLQVASEPDVRAPRYPAGRGYGGLVQRDVVPSPAHSGSNRAWSGDRVIHGSPGFGECEWVIRLPRAGCCPPSLVQSWAVQATSGGRVSRAGPRPRRCSDQFQSPWSNRCTPLRRFSVTDRLHLAG